MSHSISLHFFSEIIPHSKIHHLQLKSESEDKFVNGSHLSYQGEIHDKEYIYTFHAFYQDGFCVITMDSFHKELKTTIEHKNVYVLPIEWKLIQIANQDLMVWIIDVEKEIFLKYYILKIRKRLQEIPFLKRYIEQEEYDEGSVYIKRTDQKIKKELMWERMKTWFFLMK